MKILLNHKRKFVFIEEFQLINVKEMIKLEYHNFATQIKSLI